MRFLITIALVSVLISCKGEGKQQIKTEAIQFSKEGELTIFQAETDSTLVQLDIEIAETDYETQTGLMYRESIQENQAMLFVFPDNSVRSFYMKNTTISLDIIYIDEGLKIVSFQKNAKPLDEKGLPSQFPAQYVLEVNAGLSDTWRLAVGDRIDFTRN